MKENHRLAGKTVRLVSRNPRYDGELYRVEDWWENVYGASWMNARDNPAALMYAMHGGFYELPTDDNVVYGKIGASGHLIHESELGDEVLSENEQ